MGGILFLGVLNIVLTLLFKNAHMAHMQKKRTARLYLLVAYMIYIFFAVFRVIDDNGLIGGYDANVYKNIYSQANVGLVEYLLGHPNEKGYLFINWIAKNTLDSYQVALFIFHTIAFVFESIFILDIRIRRYNFFTWMGLFAIVGNLTFMFSMMRNCIVVSMLSVAFICMKRNKFKSSFAITLLTLLIHYSGIVMMLYLTAVVTYKKCRAKSRRTIGILFCVFLAISTTMFYIFTPLIDSRYTAYIAIGENAHIAYKSYLSIIVLLIAGRLLWSKVLKLGLQYEVIILLFTLIFFIFNTRYLIVYRMIYDMLPILYLYMIEMTEDIRLFKTRFQLGELVLIIFAFIYLPYRCYTLIMIENLSCLPYLHSFFL